MMNYPTRSRHIVDGRYFIVCVDEKRKHNGNRDKDLFEVVVGAINASKEKHNYYVHIVLHVLHQEQSMQQDIQ